MQTTTLKTALVVASIIVGIQALAACGGDNDSGSPKGEASTEDVDKAAARVKPYLSPISEIGIDEPLESLPENGLTAVALGPTVVASNNEIFKGFDEGLQTLGFQPLKVIDTAFDPAKFKSALDSAISLDPDLMLIVGDPGPFAAEFEKYQADGGTVIGWSLLHPVADNESFGVDYAFLTNENLKTTQTVTADWVIADSKGAANTAFFGIGGAGQKPIEDATLNQYKNECSGCSIDYQVIKLSDIGSKAPAQVVSYLQAHPDVRYLHGTFGDLFIGVPAALKAAGLDDRVKLVTGGNASTAGQQYVKDGEQAAAMQVPQGAFGWLLADAGVRYVTGQGRELGEGIGQPAILLTKDNLDFDPAEPFNAPADYEDQFKALWGVE